MSAPDNPESEQVYVTEENNVVMPYLESITPPGDFESVREGTLEQSIPERFSEIASRWPDKPAVGDHTNSLNYSDLKHLVGKTAAIIHREIGKPGTQKAVGLILEPSAVTAVGILGVLMSGHFFCPISPYDPLSHILDYLRDAEIELIFSTRETLPDSLKSALASYKIFFIEDVNDAEVRECTGFAVDSDQLAALIYTSGSTGIPKGIMHTHRTLLHMIMHKGNRLGISPSDQIAGLSTFTFGSYYWNVFAALLFGATLHIYDFYKHSFEGLKDWLLNRKISYFHCTPTTLRRFLDALTEPDKFPELRLVSLGGETVYPEEVLRFQHLLQGSTILSSTGATIEAWFFTSVFFRCPFPDDIEQIPMGFKNPETKVEVHNRQGVAVPPGEIGEIVVATGSLSPGYWKQPELNAEKYMLGKDGKIYFHTGDLGTFSPEGLLYHKGRIDFQVKIRGMRVELEAIEAVLNQHDGIRQAIVVGRSRGDADMELVAYMVAQANKCIPRKEIYRYLASRLSPHQIPSKTVFLDSFPLTRTYKIDRNALPEPDGSEQIDDDELIAPRTDVEKRIHDIWSEVLGNSQFGINQKFLELGGNSLGAMQIRNRITKEFHKSIPFREFFTAATIEMLAELVQQ